MGSKNITNYPEVLSEEIIEIGEAPKSIPGKPPRSALEKWLRDGLLQSALVGRKRFVSRHSIQRMLIRMNENPGREFTETESSSEKGSSEKPEETSGMS